jgi:hypothetical protein
MMKLYWQDAVKWYLRLRSSNPDSDAYWSSLTNHTTRYGDFRNLPTGYSSWQNFDSVDEIAHDDLYDKVFQHFIELRQALLQPEIPVSDTKLSEIAKQGCYIAYYAEFSLSDPAAEVISDYLFNGQTLLPPSLWVFAGTSLIDNSKWNHLLSWVPPEFVKRVKLAIDAAPDECVVDATSHAYQSNPKNQLIKLGLIEK